jgi:alpha-D-xyloside xylohydrolase
MITSYKKSNTALVVHSDDWLLRLEPFSEAVLRITCTRRSEFGQKPSRIVLPGDRGSVLWTCDDMADALIFQTALLKVRIDRRTGALSYFDESGRLIAEEPPFGGRSFDEFTIEKPVYDPDGTVETVSGIDGIRSTVDGGRMVVDRQAYHAKLEFVRTPDEALFGLGSHEEGMVNLRGQHQYLYQQNMKAVVPMLLSTRGYGLLVDCQSYMTFHDDAFGSYIWCDAVDELDYYIIAGPSFDEIIDRYHQLTGRPPLLPRWAFGYMQSKERYRTQAELVEVAGEYRRRGIPLDTIVLDWQSWPGSLWGQKTLDPERFPDPGEMMRQLHAMNVRLMISVWPNMSAGGDDYREFTERGLMLGDRTHYNPYDPAARELFWRQMDEGLFRHGIDSWWCDCSEPFEADWRGEVKPEPEERARINTGEAKKYIDPAEINVYSLLHAQAIYEGQRAASSTKRVVNLTRSAYAGQHRYSTITWSGDVSANWETLRRQVADGLNFCAAGEPYWTVDIGAFFTSGRPKQQRVINGQVMRTPWFMTGDYEQGCADLGYRELYVRWFQYGAFLPVFRSHGTGTPREVWQFGEAGEPFYDALLAADKLRYRLLPYIYSLAGQTTWKGYTMMRALAFDFPDDERACNVTDQYMFGPAFLVCPVTAPMYYGPGSAVLADMAKTRPVYLPAGSDWYDWWTGVRHAGGQTVQAEAPLERIPLFVRGGTLLPLGPDVQHAGEKLDDVLDLLVYPGRDTSFLYYDDAGDGYAYESGDYSLTRITWQDAQRALSLEPAGGRRQLTRDFRVVLVAQGGGDAAGSSRNPALIHYRGDPIRITG